MQPLATLIEVARPLLPGAREELQLSSQRSTAGQCCSANTGLWDQRASIGQHRFDIEHATDCDGCGQAAVGLQRCARCKKAQYCRWGWVAACLNGHLCICLKLAPVCSCLPAHSLVSCAMHALPPAAAGSARWRAGMPTSASAAPPEAQQAGAAAPEFNV